MVVLNVVLLMEKICVPSHTRNINKDFERIWQLFSVIRTCETQREADYAVEIYLRKQKIFLCKK